MRHFAIPLALLGAIGLSACETSDQRVQAALDDVGLIDSANLNEVMLSTSDPNEAVAYFQGASAQFPDRIDLRRGLAKSLIRAQKTTEGVAIWKQVVAMPDSTMDDQLGLADAYVRNNQWDEARATLDAMPPTVETFDRYRLEAMVADSEKNWSKADSFYETAIGLTTQPAGVLNNWGFSKLTRGDAAGAEKLFVESLKYDANRFTTKNNLVLARAAQGKYDLPVIDMTQTERAELLYTAALAAIKKGDVSVGKRLLRQAIETHPQFFEAAANSLAALEG